MWVEIELKHSQGDDSGLVLLQTNINAFLTPLRTKYFSLNKPQFVTQRKSLSWVTVMTLVKAES